MKILNDSLFDRSPLASVTPFWCNLIWSFLMKLKFIWWFKILKIEFKFQNLKKTHSLIFWKISPLSRHSGNIPLRIRPWFLFHVEECLLRFLYIAHSLNSAKNSNYSDFSKFKCQFWKFSAGQLMYLFWYVFFRRSSSAYFGLVSEWKL